MKKSTLSSTAFAAALVINSMLPLSQANAGGKFYHDVWADDDAIHFPLVRPAKLGDSCLPHAKGKVNVVSIGNAEIMDVKVKGLPKNTEFDVFVIQVPNAPFGMSWYQGDLETNHKGKGHARFIGRFNEETFIVAPGSVAAPQVHDDPFPDATDNPQTAPVHTYHVGIWFNSPEDAIEAGCPGAVTPFNGEHNAGIQILNSGTFPDAEGPLSKLKP